MARKADGGMFVPEAEQPYEIPQNWRWVRLSALVSPSKETTADFSSDIRYVGLEHMETGRGIVSYGNAQTVKSLKNVFHDGQILYGKLRPYLNKHDIADFSGVCSTDILVFEQSACSCARYVNYYFDLPYFFEYAVSHSRGIHLPRVTESILLNAACPLPPLAEQQRIVERIESLFTKLDAARENAQSVLDGFEMRKAAILHRAFSGELTRQWREDNGISQGTWEDTTLAKVVGGFRYGTSEKSAYSYSGMPVLRIPNISDNGIDFSDMKFLNSAEVESANQVKENDILIIRSNGSRDLVGKCALVPPLTKPFAYASFLIKITPSDRINPRFLLLYLNSAAARAQMFLKAKSSAGIHNINSKELGAISIRLPDLREQAEIVSIAENTLSKDEQSVNAAQQVMDNIDAMKKAILGRAFRGELGANDPSEESPETMLQDLL